MNLPGWLRKWLRIQSPSEYFSEWARQDIERWGKSLSDEEHCENQAIEEADWAKKVEAHQCHFCGTYVLNGYECGSNSKVRHWLSDCRPDLVGHEPGETCTWWSERYPADNPGPQPDCYAYQYWGDDKKQHWGTEHTNFYEDGPM